MSMEEFKKKLHRAVDAKMKFYNDMMEASDQPQFVYVNKKEYNKLLKENADLKEENRKLKNTATFYLSPGYQDG